MFGDGVMLSKNCIVVNKGSIVRGLTQGSCSGRGVGVFVEEGMLSMNWSESSPWKGGRVFGFGVFLEEGMVSMNWSESSPWRVGRVGGCGR